MYDLSKVTEINRVLKKGICINVLQRICILENIHSTDSIAATNGKKKIESESKPVWVVTTPFRDNQSVLL